MVASELAIITFSKEKYLNASTLSRIRSHAQQRVQDQKLLGKTGKVHKDAAQRSRRADAKPLSLVFHKLSGKEVKRAPRVRQPAPGRRERSQDSEDVFRSLDTLSLVRSLSADRHDPFDAFPVTVDSDFMRLFEHYYLKWKWNQPKAILFQDILSHPALSHSFLAVAWHMWGSDEVRSLQHENKTFECLQAGIDNLSTLSCIPRSEMAYALTWAIIRLAIIKVNRGDIKTSFHHLHALLTLATPDIENREGTKFSSHIQSCIASLILANFSQSASKPALLQSSNASSQKTALGDVQAHGFLVPETALHYQLQLSAFVQPEVLDILLALTALYNTLPRPESDSAVSPRYRHSGKQAIEGAKLAIRLVNIKPAESDTVDQGNSWLVEFQEIVRTTALIFTWSFGRKIVNQHRTIFAAVMHNRSFVTPKLISHALNEAGDNDAICDLVLWLLVVCGSTTGSMADKVYYSGLIRTFFPHTFHWSFSDVKRLGEKLPWIDIRHQTPVDQFWDLVTGNSQPLEADDRPYEHKGWIRTDAASPVDHTWNVAPTVNLSGSGAGTDAEEWWNE